MAKTITPRRTHLDEPRLEIVIREDAFISHASYSKIKGCKFGVPPRWGKSTPFRLAWGGPEGIDLALIAPTEDEMPPPPPRLPQSRRDEPRRGPVKRNSGQSLPRAF